MDDYLDLRGMFTWIIDCVSVTVGPVQEDILQRLEIKKFDQAPVIDEAGAVVGIVATTRLRDLFESSNSLNVDDSGIEFKTSPAVVGFECLLEMLARKRAVLVTRNSGEVVGLFTISDLNSHRFRAALYPYLARLESGLADAIDREFSDPWEWLKWLGDGAAVVVGHWEILKRRGMDLSATSGASLVQLLQIAEQCPDLVALLGFNSKTELGNFRRKISPIRNAIMHPARPLIDDVDRIGGLRNAVSVAHRACQRIEKSFGKS